VIIRVVGHWSGAGHVLGEDWEGRGQLILSSLTLTMARPITAELPCMDGSR
jgi:hypothetical protein